MTTKVGNNSSEYLWGTDSSDTLFGLGGDDTLDGFNGNDLMYGGDGNDWVYGGRNNDMLIGGSGNDHLYGQEDNDTLFGGYDGAGDDTLDGGSGYDTVDYSGLLNAVIVTLDKGYARGSDIGRDTLYGIDNIVGGEGSDNLQGDNGGIGSTGANVIDGRGGHDFINGRGGDDTLFGGAGMDMIEGGDGNDKLYGQADDDWLWGGAGDDTIDGGDGIDVVSYVVATSGVDMWNFSEHSQGWDTFVSIENVAGSRFDDYLMGDKLGFDSSNYIFGDDGNDVIDGAGGNDTLLGGAGDDRVWGGFGADLMTGGTGADTFGFEQSSAAYDTGVGAGARDIVTDFEHGTDKFQIALTHYIPGTGGSVDPTLAFIGQNAFNNTNQIRFTYEGDHTLVQANLDTDQLPEFEIQLSGYVTLGANDFIYS